MLSLFLFQISKFLTLRNIGHLIDIFKVNKIDDSVLRSVDDLTLTNLGLAYGDLIAYKLEFKDKETNPQTTYQARLQDLKDKMSIARRKTERKDSKNRNITLKSNFKMTVYLKCFENNRYVRKSGELFETVICHETSYDTVQNEAKEHFGIDKSTVTFLASYDNESYLGRINKMGEFIAMIKDKKKQCVMYLLYPKTYVRLQYEKDKENSVLKFCDVCDKEFVGFCVYCAAQHELGINPDYQPIAFNTEERNGEEGKYQLFFYHTLILILLF